MTVTATTELGNLISSSAKRQYKVSRIQDVAFYCVNNASYDETTLFSDDFASLRTGSDLDLGLKDASNPQAGALEHPCASLKKLLSTGTFYFSPYPQWDLSRRFHEMMRTSHVDRDFGIFDERFVWNEYLVDSLLDFRSRLSLQERTEFDRCQFIVSS